MQLIELENKKEHRLIGNQLTIGRSPGSDIALLDKRVSGRHASLELHRGSYILTDLGSTNGTYVNRKRLTGPYVLADNDEISFGGFAACFKADVPAIAPHEAGRDVEQTVYTPDAIAGPERPRKLPAPQAGAAVGEVALQVSEAERAAARMKSYSGPAVLVIILYIFLYIPGFIANYLYYKEAQKMQRIAGISLPGQGCLSIMLWLNVVLIVLSILGGVVLLIASF